MCALHRAGLDFQLVCAAVQLTALVVCALHRTGIELFLRVVRWPTEIHSTVVLIGTTGIVFQVYFHVNVYFVYARYRNNSTRVDEGRKS